MKELPTLPPEGNGDKREPSAPVDNSAEPSRPTLPVDTDLEIAIPANGHSVEPPSSDAPLASQNANIFSPFVVEGSLADGVDPLPVPSQND